MGQHGAMSTATAHPLKWDLRDLVALQMLAPLDGGYLPWTEWSLRPSGLAAICNEIVLSGRQALVECGSGPSTVVLARLLRQLGRGHLSSFEHDPEWARTIRSLVAAEGLDEWVTVTLAPLATSPLSLDGARWYEESAITAGLPSARVDLLVVDGPPALPGGDESARYPAVPFLRSALADDWTVALDDVDRSAEEGIVTLWEDELGTRFERIPEIGIALGRSHPGPSVVL